MLLPRDFAGERPGPARAAGTTERRLKFDASGPIKTMALDAVRPRGFTQMSSSHEPNAPDGRRPPPRTKNEELVARARVLIADPGYPTDAIVEELAELLSSRVGPPDGKE